MSGKAAQLESMYQEIILDHYKNPHGKGLREPFESEVHHVNPSCGDEITLRVHLADGVIDDVSYDAIGCSISQASVSVLTDLVQGKTVDEAMAVQREFLELMQSRSGKTVSTPGTAAAEASTVEPNEDLLEDAVAFAGVAQYPARIKCALLGWMAWKDATAQATGITQAIDGEAAR